MGFSITDQAKLSGRIAQLAREGRVEEAQALIDANPGYGNSRAPTQAQQLAHDKRGTFSKIAEQAGNVVKDVAPYAGLATALIPGVGPAVAGALGGVGKAALGGLSKIPGVSQIGSAVSSGLKKLPSGSVSGVGDWIKENGDTLLAGGEALYGGYNALQANKLRSAGLDSAEGAYNERAGLRKMGVEGMMNDTRPDLASLFANPGDPYASQPMVPLGAQPMVSAKPAGMLLGKPLPKRLPQVGY